MQEYIMFISVGVCLILMVFTFITDSIARKRKQILFALAASTMLQSISDQLADFFNGDISTFGIWITRLGKFIVYGMNIAFVYFFCLYLEDLLIVDGKVKETPRSLKLVEYISSLGVLTLLISQITGLYYTFGDNNVYTRSQYYGISYIFPMGSTLILLVTTVRYRKHLRKRLLLPLLLFQITPIITSILRFFAHEIALTSISIVGMIAVLYCFSILDANSLMKIGYQKEIELVRQTTFALVEAIDAKDSYTKGHSKRVAEYSVKIAEKAGKSKEELEKLYLMTLLHDVGKIGIPDAIINKEGRLTDEEYEVIKTHPIVGNEILSKISISPELTIGAHYHHERYDGRGYPEGLFGEEIPEFARIIAVADTYDAMASKRSYRNVLPIETIRSEFLKGIGTQFDPKYAKIMIDIIDSEGDYQMKEKILAKMRAT